VRGKPVAYDFTLLQQYQTVSGTARVADQNVTLTNVELSGAALSFELTANVGGITINHQFSGRVEGASIDGTADLSAPRLQARTEWYATRSGQAADASSPAQSTQTFATRVR
jgi:hypothetical protein